MAVVHELEKYAGESRLYNFDFAGEAEVVAGGALSSPTVTAAPTGLTIGTPALQGSVVQVRLSAGAAGTDYTVTCTALVATGNTLVRTGILKVL